MVRYLNGRLPASLVCDFSPRDFHVCYKAKPLTMDCLDAALAFAVVAKRLTRRLYPAGDRRLRDDAPVPHLLDDLVLGYQTLTVLDQQREQGKHLRLDGADLIARAQLNLGCIQLKGAESVNHGSQDRTRPPSPCRNLHAISMWP